MAKLNKMKWTTVTHAAPLIFLLMFYLCLTLALFDVFVYAGDGPLLRNFVIASGALKPLLALAHNSMNNVSNIYARGFSYLYSLDL